MSSSGNYFHLIRKIDDFIRRYYVNKIIRGTLYIFASIFTGFVIVTFAEYFGNFSPPVRTVLFYSYLALNLFILTRWLIVPALAYFHLGKTITHEQAAEIIGEHFTPVKDKLLNTLQLKKLAENNTHDRTLIDASINQKIAELSPVPFRAAVKLNENKRYLKFALAPLAVILLISFTAPAIFSESSERLLNHNRRFVKKAPFSFLILNDNLSAVQGDNFELRVKLVGNEIPDELYLTDGVNTFKLEKESIIRFTHTFNNIQETRKVRLSGGGYESATYEIEVKPKPSLLNFDVNLNYPAYLNKKPEKLTNTGDITVPAGTRITWEFTTQNARQIEFTIAKNRFSINPVKENLFRFNRTALKNFNYHVRPVNGAVINTETGSYRLTVIPDLTPSIQVTEKQDSMNSRALYFIGQASDDHGLTRLTFNYRVLNGEDKHPAKVFSKTVNFGNKDPLQGNFFHVWDVGELKIGAGQQIEYFFEVWDNDAINGSKASRSQVRVYRVPSAAEVDKKLEEGAEEIKEKMNTAIRKASEIDKEARRLNNELMEKKQLTYEDKKQVEQLLKKQADFEQLIKDIQAQNKKNLMDRRDLKDQREEILQKQEQIQELFNNVLNEKTRELLKNIEKLLEQNNKNMTQSEISKMQVDNKTMQKELDRLLELYKQLEYDQKLTESIDKLTELSKEQQELSEKTLGKNADENVLQKTQEQLKQQFSDVTNDLKQLKEKNEQLDNKNNFTNPESAQQEIQQEMQESSRNLEHKKMKQAAGNQQNAAQQMKQVSKMLEEMKAGDEEKENQINSQSLREILDNLLTTSFDQEAVMQDLRNTSGTDPAYVNLTQKQKAIQDNLKMIQDSLFSLSKKVPQIESVVNKEIELINTNLSAALGHLGERKTSEATRNQQYAMTSVNNLALMLSEALEQLQRAQNASPGGKGKKQQTLSQLSQMQEQLNKNMQKARQQMQAGQGQQGKTSSKGKMSEQMAKMAMQQQLIRQALQDINRELNKNGKGSLGNLDELSKQMEQTETDLVNKKIQQETLIRQQDILSRLLDAEKADREREPDNKRKSKAGKTFTPDYSIILKEYQKLKQRETELLKTVPASLNSFYKNRVGDYFKFLNSDNKYVK